MRKLTVIAVGNVIRCDDALGPLVLRELEKQDWSFAQLHCKIDFVEMTAYTLDLITAMEGADIGIIMDSVEDNTLTPGQLLHMNGRKLPPNIALRHFTTHGLDLPTLIRYAEELQLSLPPDIFVIGVVGKDFESFKETLSIELSEKWNHIVQEVKNKILHFIEK